MKFCKSLTLLNKAIISFNNSWFNEKELDMDSTVNINHHYKQLLQYGNSLGDDRIETMMSKECQRYDDGLVQVAVFGKPNVTLFQTWKRTLLDLNMIDRIFVNELGESKIINE